MNPASGTRRGHVELAGIGFGIGDEFGNRPGRKGGRHLHYKRREGKARDRRNVADKVKLKIVVEGGADHIGVRHRKERVTICGRTQGYLGSDSATSARAILDDE